MSVRRRRQFSDYDYSDLVAFTGRQSQAEGDFFHTVGQILAAFAPAVFGPIIGAVVVGLGIAAIGVGNGIYQDVLDSRVVAIAGPAPAPAPSPPVNPGVSMNWRICTRSAYIK